MIREHRLVPYIRLAMLSVLGTILFGFGWVYAGVGFMALGLLMPVFSSAAEGCGCSPAYSAASQFQVDISGMANGTGCTNCAELDGSYTLDSPGGGADFCNWAFNLSGISVGNCGGCFAWGGNDDPDINLQISRVTPGDVTVNFASHENNGSGNTAVIWFENLSPGGGAYPDCSAWVSQSVAYSSSPAASCGFGVMTICDGSSSTCEVTAIP
jgi:hypothetical protein